ncbi:MAG: GLUG motif-containing protein, partial [Planctomycetota bacterium]
TLVELDVEPAPSYLFDYFSGDLTGSTEPKNILMDSPKSVTVHFTLEGSGTEADPYRIATVGQLQLLSENAGYWGSNSHFVLTDDIVIPPGFIINPIGNNSIPFNGNFDGAGHTISGLFQSGSSYLGLFGKTVYPAKLRNLGVVAATINGSGLYLGILVGYNDSATTISDCYATGAVNGGTDSRNLGGLVGYNSGSISNCSATGAVNGGTDSWHLGGLVGYNTGSISNCSATGAVNGGDNSVSLGGLAGTNGGNISNCYATGAVIGTSTLGGLVGFNSGTISNCYWDINASGMTDGVGNQEPDPAGVMGRTTAQMKQEATFAGWDFTDTWLIMENQSYPYQHITAAIPGDNNGDGVVDFKDLAILCGNWLAGTEPE